MAVRPDYFDSSQNTLLTSSTSQHSSTCMVSIREQRSGHAAISSLFRPIGISVLWQVHSFLSSRMVDLGRDRAASERVSASTTAHVSKTRKRVVYGSPQLKDVQLRPGSRIITYIQRIVSPSFSVQI